MARVSGTSAQERIPAPASRKDYRAYAVCFGAFSNRCTGPPGFESAVMSLFSSAAGAFQIDQLNQ